MKRTGKKLTPLPCIYVSGPVVGREPVANHHAGRPNSGRTAWQDAAAHAATIQKAEGTGQSRGGQVQNISQS